MRLLLAAVCVAGLAFAQDEGIGAGGGGGTGGGRGMGGGGGMGGMGGGGMPRVQRVSKLEMLNDKLKLNKDQQQELLKILADGRQQAAPLLDAMDKERANIANAILNSKPDAQKKAVDDLATLRAKIVAIEAKSFAKIYATLKPKEQAKASQSFELLAGMFDASGLAGRGGRGPRGSGDGAGRN